MLTPPAHVTPDEAPLVGAGDGGRLPGRPCTPRRIHDRMRSVRSFTTCRWEASHQQEYYQCDCRHALPSDRSGARVR